jgi:hypothetical protein
LILRLTLITGILSILLLGGTLLAAQSTGTPPRIARDLREFPNCEFPCWFGIRPDETSIASANRILNEAGYLLNTPPDSDGAFHYYQPPSPDRCAVQLDVRQTIVRRIRLEDCPPTRIGDLIRVLGTPTGVLIERSGLAFADGTVIAFMFPASCDQIYKPETFIQAVDARDADTLSSYLQPWRGFRDGRYYQPHPQASVGCEQ